MQRTYDEYLQMVRKNGFDIHRVPKEMVNAEMVLEAVRQCGDALEVVPLEMLTEQVCIEAVTQHGWALRYVPARFQTPETLSAAVRQDSAAIQLIPKKKLTADLLTEAANKAWTTGNFRGNWWPKILLQAVSMDGLVLGKLFAQIQTPEVCMAAVKQNGLALQFAPQELRTLELCAEAVDRNGDAMAFVPDKLREQMKNPPGAYRVKATFTFEAVVDVRCASAQEAKSIVESGFGCASPAYHDNDSRITGWDAQVHPEKQVKYVMAGFDSEAQVARQEAVARKHLAAVEDVGSVLQHVPHDLQKQVAATLATSAPDDSDATADTPRG